MHICEQQHSHGYTKTPLRPCNSEYPNAYDNPPTALQIRRNLSRHADTSHRFNYCPRTRVNLHYIMALNAYERTTIDPLPYKESECIRANGNTPTTIQRIRLLPLTENTPHRLNYTHIVESKIFGQTEDPNFSLTKLGHIPVI